MAQFSPLGEEMSCASRISALTITIILVISAATANNPLDEARSWAQRGDLAFSEKDFPAALTAYNESLSFDPYDPLVLNSYGDTLMQMGRYADAIDAFDRALVIDPYSVHALNGRGDALSEGGRMVDSIAAYDRTIAIDPNNLHALVMKGIGLSTIGRSNEANKSFTEAIRIADREVRTQPNDAKYDASMWDMRGLALYHLGRYQEALLSINQSLEINPKYEDAIHHRSLILLKIYENGPGPSIITPDGKGTSAAGAVPTRAGIAIIPFVGAIVVVLIFTGRIRSR
jgi:tetratricopeptide (TPR) repeat protein